MTRLVKRGISHGRVYRVENDDGLYRLSWPEPQRRARPRSVPGQIFPFSMRSHRECDKSSARFTPLPPESPQAG